MNQIYVKYITYFMVAAGTVFTAQTVVPSSSWDWTKLSVSAVVAGFVALRALESQPPNKPQ